MAGDPQRLEKDLARQCPQEISAEGMNAGRCGCFLELISLSVIHEPPGVTARAGLWIGGRWPPSTEESAHRSMPHQRGLIPWEGLLEEVRAQQAEESGIRFTRLGTAAIWFTAVS